MEFNEEMIRDYLLKKVSRCNKIISSTLKEWTGYKNNEYNRIFNSIFIYFAGGYDNHAIDRMNWHKSEHSGYAYYHYLDVDSLFAYYKYLSLIISTAEDIRDENGNRYIDYDDLISALREVKGTSSDKGIWSKMCITSCYENGYYNKSRPIRLVEDNGKLTPKRHLSDDKFSAKYNESDCNKELTMYLAHKHPERIDENKLDEQFLEDVESLEKIEYVSYFVDGEERSLPVKRKEYFTDAEGYGVIKYTAGDSSLGTIQFVQYVTGEPYYGPLYDIENINHIVEFGDEDMIEQGNSMTESSSYRGLYKRQEQSVSSTTKDIEDGTAKVYIDNDGQVTLELKE